MKLNSKTNKQIKIISSYNFEINVYEPHLIHESTEKILVKFHKQPAGAVTESNTNLYIHLLGYVERIK